jgi:hypothetical protein
MDAPGFSGRSSDPSGARAIWKDFQHLIDKSSHAFNKLRDLPPFGGFNWEEHFHKAFHVYSQLWKFQQDHRQAEPPAAALRLTSGTPAPGRCSGPQRQRPRHRVPAAGPDAAPTRATAPPRRPVLTDHGLKRSEIGDIASKIGGLPAGLLQPWPLLWSQAKGRSGAGAGALHVPRARGRARRPRAPAQHAPRCRSAA